MPKTVSARGKSSINFLTKDWSCEQVCKWLEENGMKQLVNIFQENMIDGSALESISEEEWKEMIPAIGMR